MSKFGLIGRGSWGQNYIKMFEKQPELTLQVVGRNWKELLTEDLTGVIIATPPETHVDIACEFLSRHIPTMIEKPASLSSKELECLLPFENTPILVNHIHLFSAAFQRLCMLSNSKDIQAISSSGFGEGPFRTYSALWDYGSHDIAMILYVTKSLPISVWAQEIKLHKGSWFDIELDFGHFKSQTTISNEWTTKQKIFKIAVNGLECCYNDQWRPINDSPPLNQAFTTFYNAIHKKTNFIDHRLGLTLPLQVIKILEKCEESINEKRTILL